MQMAFLTPNMQSAICIAVYGLKLLPRNDMTYAKNTGLHILSRGIDIGSMLAPV